MTYDRADQYVLVFGGQSTGGALGDTWIFQKGAWVQLHPATAPSARYGATIAFDSTDWYVVLFGGLGTNGIYFNDTWKFVAGNWSLITPRSAMAPSPRAYASMTFDSTKGYAVMFGGLTYGSGGSSGTLLNDTWTFVGRTWSNLSALLSVAPSPRGLAFFAFDTLDGYSVLFGGGNKTSALSDTWEFASGRWSVIASPGSPSARFDGGMAWDGNLGALVLHGGGNLTGTFFADTWRYHAGTWTKMSVAGPPREGSALAWDGAVKAVVEFGGDGHLGSGQVVFLNDTWEFS